MNVNFADEPSFSLETNEFLYKWVWTATTGLRHHLQLRFEKVAQSDLAKLEGRLTNKKSDNTPQGRNVQISGFDGIKSLMYLYEMTAEPYDQDGYTVTLDLIDEYEEA